MAAFSNLPPHALSLGSADKSLRDLIWPLSREIPMKNKIFRAHLRRPMAAPQFSPPTCSCPLTVDLIRHTKGHTVMVKWFVTVSRKDNVEGDSTCFVCSGGIKTLSSPGGLQPPPTCPPAGNLCAGVLHNKRQMNSRLHLIWSQSEADERL